MLLRFAQRYVTSGCVVWDIGANVGLFAFAAAGLAGPEGRVVAVEPDTWLVGTLRRSSQMNAHIAPVDVLPIAVTDTVGFSHFHIANNSRATNYLHTKGSSVTGGSCEVQCVPSFTLDWMLDTFPSPAVVKIDVEGGELEVLTGAERLLRDVRPVLHLEVGSHGAVTDLLLAARYSLFDAESNPIRPVDQAVYNTIAVPEDY